jgi:hypothetical protein
VFLGGGCGREHTICVEVEVLSALVFVLFLALLALLFLSSVFLQG